MLARGGGKKGFKISNDVQIILQFRYLFVCKGEPGLKTQFELTFLPEKQQEPVPPLWASTWPPSQLREQGGGVLWPLAVHERMTHEILAPVMTQTR